jgi:23S rRNA A1618 N6-methylase RlmF
MYAVWNFTESVMPNLLAQICDVAAINVNPQKIAVGWKVSGFIAMIDWIPID